MNREERQQREQRIRELDTLKWSQRDIANDVHASKSTVQRVLKEKASTRGPRIPGAFVEELNGRRSFKAIHLANRITGAGSAGNSWIGGAQGILPPPAFDQAWRALDLSQNTLDMLTPDNLIDLLSNASPDISRALWDTVQMVDPSHEIICWDVNAAHRTKHNKRAQKAADALTLSISNAHGSEGALYAQLTTGAFMRGAWFSELVPDPKGKLPVDIVAVDPMTIRFRLMDDPVYGQRYVLGQMQNVPGRGIMWVSIENERVIYIPIQPRPGSPYGTPPVAPAIFPALFLLSVLYDLKRVVSQQGYLRYGIKILVDKVQEIENIENTDELKEALDILVADIQKAWADQRPDDTYVFPDYIEPETYDGALQASSSTVGSADSLIGALERMLVRALKSMPIVMGSAEGVSEANANRQWEMYMASINSFQDDLASMMERHYTTALNMQGLQADVEIKFEQVRASEAYRDAQALLIKLTAAEKGENLGYIDQDEGAMSTYCHPAVRVRAGTPAEEGVDSKGTGDTPSPDESTNGEADVSPNKTQQQRKLGKWPNRKVPLEQLELLDHLGKPLALGDGASDGDGSR